MQNLMVSSVCVSDRRLGRVELARHTVAGLAPPDAASAFAWSVGVPKPGERTAQQVVARSGQPLVGPGWLKAREGHVRIKVQAIPCER